MDTQRKDQEMKQRGEIDRAKLVQNKDISDEKLDQNEDLAILRADTSLVKQQMGDQNRKDIARMKAKDVKVLKGPKS